MLAEAQVTRRVTVKKPVRFFRSASLVHADMVLVTYPAVSIAVPTADDVEPALAAAAAAVEHGARMVEWRVDELAGRPDDVAGLVSRAAAPSIVTCRGLGAEALYEHVVLADSPPRYIDIDLDDWRRSEPFRERIRAALDRGRPRDLHASLILSTHDFKGRPADLLQRIEAMAAEPACSVVKLAWFARSLRDNLEALDVVADRPKPTIALCMGEFGLMSRVLAGKSGALLTYASTGPGAETAPGQPTLAELIGRYRFESIGPATAVYGVIGWPVAQSLGPVIHNAGFAKIGYDGVYLPLPIPPEYEHFKATVGAMVDHPVLVFRGASVTLPHKDNLIRFVEERGGRVDEVTRRLGAANTLIVGAEGALECTNTDAPIILASLCGAMGIEATRLRDVPVAVLGAGGVARAVTGALSDAGADVVVFNRTRARGQTLVDGFRDRRDVAGRAVKVSVGDPGSIAAGKFRIFVNCTPLGMTGGPAPDASPLPDDVPLDASVTVFDTVYAPRHTPLLRHAEAAGARTIGGLGMFLRQAALQFLVWTGSEAPIDAFEEAVKEGTEGQRD